MIRFEKLIPLAIKLINNGMCYIMDFYCIQSTLRNKKSCSCVDNALNNDFDPSSAAVEFTEKFVNSWKKILL